MPSADELRAQLHVAELEEELAAAKDSDEATRELKDELRYARWVQRGGPAEEEAALAAAAEARQVLEDAGLEAPEDSAGGHTNRATRDLYQRWLSGQEN